MKARLQGYQCIAGVDEAGRGPLAGPVVAAACILPQNLSLPGIDDSKKLTAKQRSEFYELLIAQTCYGIGIIEVAVIDEINILQATFLAMIKAVQALRQKADYILVDGPYTPKFDVPSLGIIDGDALCPSIMAASILAKHTRDQLMIAHHDTWPHYGFQSNKGYGTAHHLEALRTHGPCEIHRRSFAPVRAVMEGTTARTECSELDLLSTRQK